MTHEIPEDFKYKDILFKKPLFPRERKHIAMGERAAQFMPFDALTGFDETIAATERLSQAEDIPELGEVDTDLLGERMQELIDAGMPSREVTVSYLDEKAVNPDERIRYVTGTLRRIDPVERKIHFTDGPTLSFSSLRSID